MSKSTKNTILNENTIRRFMKLASIEPLAETFITEMEDESMMEGHGGRSRNGNGHGC